MMKPSLNYSTLKYQEIITTQIHCFILSCVFMNLLIFGGWEKSKQFHFQSNLRRKKKNFGEICHFQNVKNTVFTTIMFIMWIILMICLRADLVKNKKPL